MSTGMKVELSALGALPVACGFAWGLGAGAVAFLVGVMVIALVWELTDAVEERRSRRHD